MGPQGDHARNGGKSSSDGEFQAGDNQRQGLHGAVSQSVSDQGCFYAVGSPAVVASVSRESA